MGTRFNTSELRVQAIEIFEELYDACESLSAGYEALEEKAKGLLEAYDTSAITDERADSLWDALQEQQQGMHKANVDLSHLIVRCKHRIRHLTQNPSGQQCLTLVSFRLRRLTNKATLDEL